MSSELGVRVSSGFIFSVCNLILPTCFSLSHVDTVRLWFRISFPLFLLLWRKWRRQMVRMRTRSGLHWAWIFFPFLFLLPSLFFLIIFFLIVLCSCPCVPPLLPIHVPSLLWAVFPLCPVFVVISVGGQDKGVIEVTVSLGFFSPAVVEVAEG